ncbi:MAG: hypothetical protein ACI8RD_012925, partial [Bacillariaceae sp.]
MLFYPTFLYFISYLAFNLFIILHDRDCDDHYGLQHDGRDEHVDCDHDVRDADVHDYAHAHVQNVLPPFLPTN